MKRPANFRMLLVFATLFTVIGGSQRALGDTSAPARVSYIYGSAAYEPAGDVDWSEVVVNLPLLNGDRIFTHSDSRVEIELAFANRLRLNEETEVLFIDVSGHEPYLKVELGDVIVRVSDTRKHHIQTPFATVVIETKGLYRINVDNKGPTRVTVRKGRAQVDSGQHTRQIHSGETLTIERGLTDLTQVATGYQEDQFDRWSARRDAIFVGRHPSSRYVHSSVAGLYDLDWYGDWEHLGGYGSVWFPRVSVGWVPYRSGRWVFYPFYGWTWLSYEPWGWAPYHYGDWIYYSRYNRWCWVPGGYGVRLWGGAHVNFYFGDGYIGWCPRPYRRGGYRGRYRPRGRPGRGDSRPGGERRFRGNLRGLTAVALNGFGSGRTELYRTEPERLRARFRLGLPDRFRNPLGGSVDGVVSASPKPMAVRSLAAGFAIKTDGKTRLRRDQLPTTSKGTFGRMTRQDGSATPAPEDGATLQGAPKPVTPELGRKVILESKPVPSRPGTSAQPRDPTRSPAVVPNSMRPGSNFGGATRKVPRPVVDNNGQRGSSKVRRMAPTSRAAPTTVGPQRRPAGVITPGRNGATRISPGGGASKVRRMAPTSRAAPTKVGPQRRPAGVTTPGRNGATRISPGGASKVRRMAPTSRAAPTKVGPQRRPAGVTTPGSRGAPRVKARSRSSVNRAATRPRRRAPSTVGSRSYRSRAGAVARPPKIRSNPRISAPVRRSRPSVRRPRVSRPNRPPAGQFL